MKAVAVILMVALALPLVMSVSIADNDMKFRFQQFMNKYNKKYLDDSEFSYRFRVYSDNINMIEEHNAQNLDWSMGENEYADMTWEEFRRGRFGYNASLPSPRILRRVVDLTGTQTIPDTIDWSSKGAVTPIKNQGQCGSCWSFSTTGAVEGAYAIKTGSLVSLSEQELVDCSRPEGNMGCNGGLMDSAFTFVEKNGLCQENSYPYEARDDSCRMKTCKEAVEIHNFVDVPHSNEMALKAAVAQQPVAIAIEADQFGFQFYHRGVFSGRCGTQLDHGVLVVGYGDLNGALYWKVKNSWGASWGDSGYILLKRTESTDSNGQCGIAMQASYPIV